MAVQGKFDNENFIEELKSMLVKDLPGAEAQYRMAPDVRLEDTDSKYRNAAVMILLFSRNHQICTVLMKRSEYPGAHSKQISFPGGKYEEQDRDLHETALRETREELGIDHKQIQLLGELSPLNIPVSGIKVLPVVGYYPGSPEFHPDHGEVQFLIETSLEDILLPDTRQENIKTILCKLVRVPYYNIGGNQVWGATAMILSEFLEIIRRMDPALLQ